MFVKPRPTCSRSDRGAGGARGRRGVRGARGFTLLESALATVIIGVGVLALVEAQATFSRNNDYSSSSATAAYLAGEIRERMRVLPRHDPVTGLFVVGSGSTATLSGWGPDTGETLAEDFDDVDDFDGQVFGAGGNRAGPLDAYNRVITQVQGNGTTELDGNGAALPLRGWAQRVTVDKVDPFNFSTVRAKNYSVAPAGSDPGIAVGGFPLRVTVRVTYQGPLDFAPREMARVVWVVPN
ncbi:hypothetical protein BH11PLA1_BH11PLA1_22130 [soil metagenome]